MIFDDPEGLEVRVRPDPLGRTGLVGLALAFALLYEGVSTGKQLAAAAGPPWSHPSAALLAVVCTVVSLLTIGCVVWRAIFRESLLLTPSTLVTRRTRLGLGPRRVYPLHDVERLGAVSDARLRSRKGGIAFTAGGRRIHFGRGLAPEQTVAILRTLHARSHIPYSDGSPSPEPSSGAAAPDSSL